ncbi:MAG: MerR family transcriptional regulator [Pontixanthobacter sp.]
MSAQFDDGKDSGALRTIGEVSRALGVKTHVLRYWEQQFPMLEPLKRSGGRRYYRAEDVELIETINRLVNDEGYTLKGAQQVIESGKGDASEKIARDGANTAPDEVSRPSITSPIPIITDGALPSATDGGVDAFFGRESYASDFDDAVSETADEAADGLSIEPQPEMVSLDFPGAEAVNAAETSSADSLVQQEIVAKLKSIRLKLAEALAA